MKRWLKKLWRKLPWDDVGKVVYFAFLLIMFGAAIVIIVAWGLDFLRAVFVPGERGL